MSTRDKDKTGQADSWVTVYEPVNQAESAVIEALLRDAGFQTYVKQETIGIIYAVSVGALGAQIQVRASELDAAQEFLNAHFAALESAPDEEPEDE